MTEEQKARIHDILCSCDSREELAERIVALEELVAEMYDNLSESRQAYEILRDELTSYKSILQTRPSVINLLYEKNERLRELVRDYFNAPCLECNPWAEGWEGCKHCESGNCTLATRTLELGIEVDG